MDKRCGQKYGFIMNIVFNDKHQLDEEFYFLNVTGSGNERSEQFRKMSNTGVFGNSQIILYNGRSYLFAAFKGGGSINEPNSRSDRVFISPVCSVHKKRTQ
jgi:DNA-binding transcriptional regulator WhiA